MLNATLIAGLGSQKAFKNGTYGTIGEDTVWKTENGEIFEISESGVFGETAVTRVASHCLRL